MLRFPESEEVRGLCFTGQPARSQEGITEGFKELIRIAKNYYELLRITNIKNHEELLGIIKNYEKLLLTRTTKNY